MVTYSETRELTFRKDVHKQGIDLPNLLEALKLFCSPSSVLNVEQ